WHGYLLVAFVIGGAFPGIEDLSVDKRTRDTFRIPRGRQRVTNGAAALLRGAQATAANGRNWQNGRNVIQAFQAQDFFDEIDVFFDIGAPGWNGDIECLTIVKDSYREADFYMTYVD